MSSSTGRALPDSVFPTNLRDLGFYISQYHQVRDSFDDSDFRDLPEFAGNTVSRTNEVRRNTFYECIRREVYTRLGNVGMRPIYLPQVTAEKPAFEKSIPIIASDRSTLLSATDVIIVVGKIDQDPGIWSYESVYQSSAPTLGSLMTGSAQRLALELRRYGEFDAPGLVLFNPGQLFWSETKSEAMTFRTWNAQPRRTMDDEPTPVGGRNRIPQNATVDEHIFCAFARVIANPGIVNKDAKLYFIGIGSGGRALVTFMQRHLHLFPTELQYRVTAVVLTGNAPPPPVGTDGGERFRELMNLYTKFWQMSPHVRNVRGRRRETFWTDKTVVAGRRTDDFCILQHNLREIVEWLMAFSDRSQVASQDQV